MNFSKLLINGSHNSYINSIFQVSLIDSLKYFINNEKYTYASENDYENIKNHFQSMLNKCVTFFEIDVVVFNDNLCVSHIFKSDNLSTIQIEKIYDFEKFFSMLVPIFESFLKTNNLPLFIYFDTIDSSIDSSIDTILTNNYGDFLSSYFKTGKIDFMNTSPDIYNGKSIFLYNSDLDNVTSNGNMISLSKYLDDEKTPYSVLNISNFEAKILPSMRNLIFSRVYPSDRLFSLNYDEDEVKDKFNIICINYFTFF